MAAGSAPPAGVNVANAADGSSCATATSTECRWNRLDALFGYFAANGLDSVELFGHAGLPTNENINGPYGWADPRTARQARPARRRLARQHERGRLARARHGRQDDRPGLHRLRRHGRPGPGHLRRSAGHSAATLNRLGKHSVEAGVGQVYIHNHTDEFDAKYVDNGVIKSAWEILMEQHRPALRRGRGRRRLGHRRVRRSDDRRAYQQHPPTYGDRETIEMMHVKDLTNIAPQFNPGRKPRGQPVVFGTGEINYGPIFAAAKNKSVKWYQPRARPPNPANMVTDLRNLFGPRRSSFDTPPRRRRDLRVCTRLRRRSPPNPRVRPRSRTPATRR